MASDNSQTNVELTRKFDDWKFSWWKSLNKRMPWFDAKGTEKKALLTTSSSTTYYPSGSIIWGGSDRYPSDWIGYGGMQNPGVIWYWLNEDDCDEERKPGIDVNAGNYPKFKYSKLGQFGMNNHYSTLFLHFTILFCLCGSAWVLRSPLLWPAHQLARIARRIFFFCCYRKCQLGVARGNFTPVTGRMRNFSPQSIAKINKARPSIASGVKYFLIVTM